MVKEVNFEMFNYLNEIQEQLSFALADGEFAQGQEYTFEPEERKIYLQTLGFLEYAIEKLDKLFKPAVKEIQPENKLTAFIFIKDNENKESHYKYTVEFKALNFGSMIPVETMRGAGQAIRNIKKDYDKDYNIKVKDLRAQQ